MDEHKEAKKIVETLSQAGFVAYYAGGWVRDFLLGLPSDDIDIATSAPPETVQSLFPHTVPIGISFGIILVILNAHQYEVATFREDLEYQDGRRPSRIAFTSAVLDAKRRDFTINGMFYDPLEEKILDFVEGRQDLEKKIIRAIGNPHERIKEDRLRMIRAVRLSCRFQFSIEQETKKAIVAHAEELFPSVAIERIWQELQKAKAFLYDMLVELHALQLLQVIFPETKEVSLQEIQKRLSPISHYPKEAPCIASLLPLFPSFSLQDQIALCKKLKLSQTEMAFVTFLSSWTKGGDLRTWAHLYANPIAETALKIFKAHEKNPDLWLNAHLEKREKLLFFIERIQNKDPIVKSEDLLREGILPGKKMGQLLHLAEKIAIDEALQEAELVIRRLKQTDLWKTP